MCDYARFSDPEKRQTMQKFDSITEFLKTGDFHYRVFDMGRKVCPISNTDFEQIEKQKKLFPYPFQQKAWLALLFWPENKQDQAVIWFLQFPIDELGYLKQQSRDAFLIDLLEQTGKNIQAKQKGEEVEDELGESPFAFKPREDRLAMFHALATVELGQKPSQHYQYAHDYLLPKGEGGPGYEQWQFLGVQGIADVVTRLDEEDNAALLADAIPQMPSTPLQSFAHSLENIIFDKPLFDAILTRLRLELNDAEDIVLLAALIRSISSQAVGEEKTKVLTEVLQSPAASQIEVIAAISGRSWVDLENQKLLSLFVEKLAFQEQMAFNAILADLIMIPGMRDLVLATMRDENRSAELTQRFGQFMQAISSS